MLETKFRWRFYIIKEPTYQLVEICHDFKDVAICQKKIKDRKSRIEERIIKNRKLAKEKEKKKRENKWQKQEDYVDHKLLRIYYKIKNMNTEDRKNVLVDIVYFLKDKFASQKKFANITPFMNDLWLSSDILSSYMKGEKSYISKNTIIFLIDAWYTFDL